jgi:hypothetical protein
MMDTPYKLQVKIGTAEFSAEGPEKSVKEQFNAFLEAVKTAPLATPGVNQGIGTNNNNPPLLPNAEGIDQAILNRIFTYDEEKGAVSLRILPRTDQREADAIMILLYGFRQLTNKMDVSSSDLMKSARQSGLQFNRLDHTISTYKNLITEGGLRRGKRYGLNNQGVNHAVQIIRGIL